MVLYEIPVGMIGFRGTAEAFAKAESELGPLPPGPYLDNGLDQIRLFRYSGPARGVKVPDGLELLTPGRIIETE